MYSTDSTTYGIQRGFHRWGGRECTDRFIQSHRPSPPASRSNRTGPYPGIRLVVVSILVARIVFVSLWFGRPRHHRRGPFFRLSLIFLLKCRGIKNWRAIRRAGEIRPSRYFSCSSWPTFFVVFAVSTGRAAGGGVLRRRRRPPASHLRSRERRGKDARCVPIEEMCLGAAHRGSRRIAPAPARRARERPARRPLQAPSTSAPAVDHAAAPKVNQGR